MKSGSQGVKLIALPADIMDSTYPRVKSQLVEQWTENPCVTGSSPVPGILRATTEKRKCFSVVLSFDVPKSRPGHCLGSHIEGIESNKWARTFFEGLSRKFYTTLTTWSRQLMQMPGNEYSYQPDEFPTCRVVDFRTHKRDQEKHPLLQSLCSQTVSTRLRFHFTRSGTEISCQCALAVWAFTTVPERRTCLLSNMDRLCGTT